jgi:hypothetical protein
LIPLIWLAVTTLVVAACQVAARGDASQPSSTLAQDVLDQPAVLDQRHAQDHIAISQRRYATARGRKAMLHQAR